MTHPSPTGPSQPSPPPSPRDRRPVGTLAQYRLPGLVDIVSDARNDGTRMLATLRRNYDPASAPDSEAYPGLTDVDVLLSRATSLLREALRELAALSALGLPSGSAVLFSVRSDARRAHSALGGPSQSPTDHRSQPGERRSPGYAASDTASESVGSAIPTTATSARPGSSLSPGTGGGSALTAAGGSGEGGSFGDEGAREALFGTARIAPSTSPCICRLCRPQRSSWANAPARPLGAPPT
jgi:hypothetical protein